MRCPHPTRLDTSRQRAAYLFVFEYVRVSNDYGRPAPLDIRVQVQRKNYLHTVAAEKQRRGI